MFRRFSSFVPLNAHALFASLAGVALLTSACSGSNSTPSPRPSSATPTPDPSGATPTPKPSGATPTPNPSGATPTPKPTATPTPGASATPGASPTPIDANHVAFVLKLAPEAISGAPSAVAASTWIYITGQQTGTTAGATCTSTNLQVTDAHGDTAAFPTGGTAVTGIPFYGAGTTSGNTSQVIQIPALCSGRIYVSVNGPLSITTTSGPSPWAFTGASGFAPKYDTVEFSMPANGLAAPSTDIDTSQENMIGLDLGLQLVGTQHGTQQTGVKDGFMTQVESAASAIGSPWSTVINSQWPTRLLSPLSVQYVLSGSGSTLPEFNPGTFLDGAIASAWNNYASPHCMNVTVSSSTAEYLAGKTVVGQVDPNGNFDFYDPAHVSACGANLSSAFGSSSHIVAQIPSPFNNTFWIDNVTAGWSSASGSELMENGPYLLPTSAPSSGGTKSFTNLYPKSSADIGNTVATALNRGVFDPTINAAYANQPYCPASLSQLYPSSAAPTQNMWATAVWSVAKNLTYGYGKAYAIPYDDRCGNSTDIEDSGARVITVTVNAN